MKQPYIKIITLLMALAVGVTTLTGCSVYDSITNSEETESNLHQNESNSIMYNQLTESQKIAYDSIVNGLYEFKEEINIDSNLSDVKVAYDFVLSDHPELFYTDGYVYNEKSTILGNIASVSVFPNYICTDAEYDVVMEKIDTKINDFLETIDRSGNDYEISEDIYETVVNQVSYNTNTKLSNTMAAAFLNKEATCGGYAAIYSYLMQESNIPCATVKGTLNGQDHVWNVSIIDGDYYLSDLTNADAALLDANGNRTEYINYSYLNMNPEFVSDYRATDIYAFITYDSNEMNYYTQHGTYYDSYVISEVSDAINEAKNNGSSQVTLAFSSEQALQYAENNLFVNKQIQGILGNVNVSYTDDIDMYTLTIIF